MDESAMLDNHNWIKVFEHQFRSRYGAKTLSSRFAYLASVMLAEDFFKKTGIDVRRPKGKIALVQRKHFCFFGENNGEGTIEAGISVFHYGSNAVIKWKSISAKRISVSSQFIDKNEVFIWFSELNVDSIKKSYAKIHKKPRFDLSPYNFEVTFEPFYWENVFFQFILIKQIGVAEKLTNKIDKFISEWNLSQKYSKTKKGLVHQVSYDRNTKNYFQVYMDLGTASSNFLRFFFEYLNELGVIKKITITSFP